MQGSDNGVAKCFISSNKNMTTYKRQINNSSEDLQKLCRENMKKKIVNLEYLRYFRVHFNLLEVNFCIFYNF